MSNEESPLKNTEFGVMCNDLGSAFVVRKTAKTLKKATLLLKKTTKRLGGEPEYYTDYCSQFDRGQHGETLVIIENPKELIRELDECGCRDPKMPSDETIIWYDLDDKGDLIWERYTSKYGNM
jgi:hypothetical protein